MKKLAGAFILIGFIFLGVGGYQYLSTVREGNETLREANALLAQPIEPIQDKGFIFKPEKGETVGLLNIDKIDAAIPIIEGTDPDELRRGVGHLAQTAYPGENDQILFSGHRDTVFTRLGEIEVGDIISVELPHGTFDYEMVDSKIVSADDTTVIGSTAPDEELVVTTCYPFGYIGHAPDRYVIYAVPVEE